MNQCERNYNVTEKELLSVVFACSKFCSYILGYPVTVRTDHKSISFLRRCKLSHGRLTRCILALQEYDLRWEYIPGNKNVVADVLSRINLEAQTFEGEKERILKIYNIIRNRSDLEALLLNISIHQQSDPKLSNIKDRLAEQDGTVTRFYCLNHGILFIKTSINQENWKIIIPTNLSLIHI